MLELCFLAFSSFMIAFTGAMIPGTLLTACIAESARRGARAGPLLIVGHGLLELVLVAALVAGLAPFFENAILVGVIGTAGGVVLLWIAVSIFRKLPETKLDLAVDADEKRAGLVATGALMSVVNPAWSVWWATIGLGLIVTAGKLGTAGLAVFFVAHVAGDLVWYTAVSVAVGKGRRFMDDRVYRIVLGVCAAFLVALAGWFLHDGVRTLATAEDATSATETASVIRRGDEARWTRSRSTPGRSWRRRVRAVASG